MVARYAKGARYARHLDANPEKLAGERRLTSVYYLNPDWNISKGGFLRIHLPDEVGKTLPAVKQESDGGRFFDIEPVSDRLVLFASGWLEHEVLPTSEERLAITTWFY